MVFCLIVADCFQIGVYAEGKVVKVTQESIHIVVLGFASVVIANEDIRDEFVYQVVSTYSLSCFKIHSFLLCQILIFGAGLNFDFDSET